MQTSRNIHAAAALLVLSFGAGVCMSAASAEKFRKLASPQIRAKFTGMQFTDGVHWGEVYAANGSLTSTEMGKKRVGRWRVERDQLCTDLGREGGENCYEVWT